MKKISVRKRKTLNHDFSRAFSVVSIFSVALITNCVQAEDEYNLAIMGDYKQPGQVNGRGLHRDLGNESVDPLSGMLKLNVVDLTIPGNGGLDIVVQRYYTGLQGATAVEGTPLRGRSVIGLGWDIHMGRIWTQGGELLTAANHTGCRMDNESSKFNPVLELPDGSRKQLITSSLELPDGSRNQLITSSSAKLDYAFITKDFWVARCLTTVGGGLEVHAPNGLIYTFSDTGFPGVNTSRAYLLSRIEDSNENSISIEYTNAGNQLAVLRKITANDGRTVDFEYHDRNDGKILLKKVSAASTLSVEYDYEVDSDGPEFLTKVSRPDDSYWSYDYYDSLEDNAVGKNALKSITNPLKMKTTYSYAGENLNRNGQDVSWVVDSKKTSGSVSENGVWTYTYDPAISEGDYDITTVSNNVTCSLYKHRGDGGLKMSTSNLSDELWLSGTLVSETIYGSGCKGPIKRLTEYEWYKLDISSQNEFRPIPGGGPRSATFLVQEGTSAPILKSRTITQNDVKYIETRSDFDDVGNPGIIVRSQNRTEGLFGQVLEEKQRTTRYKYASLSTVWKPYLVSEQQIDGVSGVHAFSYNEEGLLKQEDYYGIRTQYEYDAKGNVKKTIDANGNEIAFSSYYRGVPRAEVHPENLTIARIVDYFGNVTKETRAGRDTSYRYDKLNRLTKITTPRDDDNDVTMSYTYSAASGLTQTTVRGELVKTETYDGAGLLSESTVSGAGKTILRTFDYDVLGRKVFASFPNSLEGVKTEYDELGRVLSETITVDESKTKYDYENSSNSVEVTDPLGNKTIYYYASYGDPDERELIKIESPENVVTEFERNDLGLLEKLTQGGKSITYQYNTRWQKIKETGPGVDVLNYDVDFLGNVTATWSNNSPKTNFSYDGLNRLKLIDYPDTTPDTHYIYDETGNLKTLEKGDVSWLYAYDDNDQLATETLKLTGDNDEFLVRYSRNKNDVIEDITYPNGETVGFSPDDLGRPTKVGRYISDITFYDNGQLEGFTGANGVKTKLSQDERLRPTGFEYSDIKGSELKLTYGYDANSNVDSITDAQPENDLILSYDGLNRLRYAKGWWGDSSFDYDQRGNIVTKSVGSAYFTYQYENERLVATNGSSTFNFQYDEYGNVSQRSDNMGGIEEKFTFDHASNLVKTERGGAQIREYRYDGHNRRVWDIDVGSNTVAKYTLYNRAGKLLYEVDPEAQTSDSYFYLGNLLVAKKHEVIQRADRKSHWPCC